VVEWRNVEYWYNSTIISFEAILYENGDIVYQYQSLPDSYWPSVGIEDSVGYDGLQYSAYWSGNPLDAIRFYYPAPAARVLVSPGERAGGFAPIGGHKDFNITISNAGTLGADTYDLTITSGWPVTFYASNGVTPLTDTDADTVIDTGPLPQGTSTIVIARFNTPGGAQIGDHNTGVMKVKSSLNLSKTQMLVLDVSVPAGFTNVFQDNADGSMSFMTVGSRRANLSKVTVDNYVGYFPVVISLTNGNYLYAWSKTYSNANNVWRDIEYVVLDRDGNIILPITKLTNNSNTTIYTEEYVPSFAVAPNGTVGVVWYRRLENPSTNQFNYNVYFATFNSSGNLLTGPINLTNNTIWGTYDDLNVPQFYQPTIAASDDNRFIIGWEYYQHSGNGYMYDIWYAVRGSTGTNVFPPTVLTIDGMSWEPVLNSLTGGKVIMTWGTDINRAYYAVIGSNGIISKPASSLGLYPDLASSPDAVQLPNGKIALAWAAHDSNGEPNPGMELAILDSSYNILYGPTFAYNPSHPSFTMSDCVSVTTDSSSHVIMTSNGPKNWLLYSLGNDTGTFITDPMIYKTSGNFISVNCNGQGNAPYVSYTFSDVPTNYWAQNFVEQLYQAGITGGCALNPLKYCPETTVTRAQMAIFLERGIHGSSFNPPAVGGSTGFEDVSPSYWAAAWIKQLAAEGITGGCGSGVYCPEVPVTRAQMAIFLLRSKYGTSYNPPAVGISTGFGDVNPNYWAAAWIKQLVTEGITAGCGSGTYCPEQPVTRAQMAVFLVRTFNLP